MGDYEANRGDIASLTPRPAASGEKRGDSSIAPPSPARAPPLPKRSRLSLPRRAVAFTAGAIARIVAPSDVRDRIAAPPAIERNARSPAEVIARVYDVPPTAKAVQKDGVKDGWKYFRLIPHSKFLTWMRFSLKNKYVGLSDAALKKAIANRRKMMTYHFSRDVQSVDPSPDGR